MIYNNATILLLIFPLCLASKCRATNKAVLTAYVHTSHTISLLDPSTFQLYMWHLVMNRTVR